MCNDYLSPKDAVSLNGKLLKNEVLQNYTSWRVGGAAKYLYKPDSIDDLALFLSLLPVDEPVVCLGAGTNVLVRDSGFSGTVIMLKGVLENIIRDATDPQIVYVESGVLITQLAHFAAELELTGLEFITGVPGTVGGALAMNAGAFGGEIWDSVIQVETIDRYGKRYVRKPGDFTIDYRNVRCKKSGNIQEWFVAAHFALQKGNKNKIFQAMHKWITKRKTSQPLDLPNAGSVFRNPHDDKAARIIEAIGLKGYRIGGACVSEKHANFIVNDKHATATDIELLINYVVKEVQQKTGIELEREIKILG